MQASYNYDCTQQQVHLYALNASRSSGKERDAESGLDYFGARYYASSMGRFMSPDWAAKATPVPYAELSDPQSLNLYSYVRNNPLSRADKDGHCDAPSNLKVGQVGVCVASYISSKSFDVVGDGDNRTTNGNGGTSRIQTTFTLDPTTGKTDKPADGDQVAKSTLMGGHLAAQGTGSSQVSPTATTDANGNMHVSVDQSAQSAYDKGGGADWLTGQLRGNSVPTDGSDPLDGLLTFMTGRAQEVSGFWKMVAGPLNGQDNWAGPGGMGPPRGEGDWRAAVHDYNFNTNGITIGSYFNPTLSPATSKALIQSNGQLMKTGGVQGAKEKMVFGVINAFQWYANSWK